VTEKQGQMK